jgi:hypothetical protein
MNAKQSAVAKIRERATEFADLANVHFDNGKTLVTSLNGLPRPAWQPAPTACGS